VSDAVTAPRAEQDRATRSRSRILAAARVEFAASGFGGGRVERIAAGAGVNKERIYAYFTDKRGLFVATIASAVQEVGETVGAVTEDLAGFAGRLFDFLAEHPETLRLLSWARLEASEPMATAAEHLVDLARPEDDIARWQAEGRVSRTWDPHDLVVVIWGLAQAALMPPFRPTGPDMDVVERRRRELVTAVVGLLAQHDETEGNRG
jgi:AcrR family transcriptional regulator